MGRTCFVLSSDSGAAAGAAATTVMRTIAIVVDVRFPGIAIPSFRDQAAYCNLSKRPRMAA
jgi:hypothetical protein